METRVLIPHGLRLIVTDTAGVQSVERNIIKSSTFGRNTEEDNEEKPSSSSGHCETSEGRQEKQSKSKSKGNPGSSSDGGDDNNSWKKEYRGKFTSTSSSSSSLSPTSSDSSSSSENEAEVEYFMNNCRKSDKLIGSSSNPFECKKSSSSTKKWEKDNDTKESEKTNSHVKICVARVIEKGTVFTPDDGNVQVVYLKGIPAIPKDDVRFMFGGFETISPNSFSPPPPSSCGSDPHISPASTTTSTAAASPPLPDTGNSSNFVRLCNWIRFLRRSGTLKKPSGNTPSSQSILQVGSDSEENAENKKKQSSNMENYHKKRATSFYTKKNIDSHCPNFTNDSSKTSFLSTAIDVGSEMSNNIIARLIDGRPTFEVTERLVPGTELVAYFDIKSFQNYASATSPSMMPKMMSNIPTMTATVASAAATPFQPVIISPSPPAPYSSSARISSSSSSFIGSTAGSISSKAGSGGGGVKKERDEKDLLQQHYQRQLSLFHHAFHNHPNAVGGNNALFKDSREGNPFPLWQTNFNDTRFSRKEDGKKHETFTHGSFAEGPLDLSKFPVFGRTHHEPLKVGTPFDSPDSNDDDMVKSSPSPVTESESGASSLFSIKNVLKPQALPGSTSKLFQPYSLELGKKSDERDALMTAFINKNRSNATGPLVTPPSSSDDPLSVRNSTGLRPILRTRGRERSLLPCEVCGKAFDRPSLLKRHLRTHTGEKPHICDVCSKGFSTSSSLNTHRRIHSGEKPHQCPICGKRFTASSNLYYHRMTHNKEKPHKCMLCGKSFPTPGDLKSHQYVHSGSWPYTCPVCHRGFSKQTNLRNHLLLHSGMTGNASGNKTADKQHTCQVCDKKFAQACNLRAHIKTHEESDSATSTCSMCKRTFLLTSNMLLGGRCRDCLLSLPSSKSSTVFARNQRDSTSSSPVTTPCINTPAVTEQGKEGFASAYDVPSLLSHRMAPSIGNANQQPLAPSLGHLGLPLSQFPGLNIPGLASALQFPTNAPGSLHFPMNGNHAGSNAADLFVNAGTTPPNRNALLEQLIEWNYRMKESVGIGSLGFSIMQQKLLESRMLAAQLMNTHGFGMNGGMQDILGLRSTMTSEGFPTLDPVVPGESKFMQR